MNGHDGTAQPWIGEGREQARPYTARFDLGAHQAHDQHLAQTIEHRGHAAAVGRQFRHEKRADGFHLGVFGKRVVHLAGQGGQQGVVVSAPGDAGKGQHILGRCKWC